MESKHVKSEYNALLKSLNKDYEVERWHKSKIKEMAYLQTKKSIKFILKNKKFNESLEIGCGPGIWTDLFLEKSNKIMLLDISEEMLKQAKNKYKDNKNVSFICEDFNSVKISKKFDGIFAIRVFEYFKNKKKAVDKLINTKTTKGEIIIITKNPDYLPKLIFKLLKKINLHKPFLKIRFFRSYDKPLQEDWISYKEFKKICPRSKIYPVIFGLGYNPFYKKEINYLVSFFTESYLVHIK